MHAHAHHHGSLSSGSADCKGLHDHAHGHGHGHGGHHHAPADFGKAFLIGIALNTAFVVIEAAAGLIYGSMALLADAGHNLSDVLALALAWVAAIAAKRPPAGRFTYGYKRIAINALTAMLFMKGQEDINIRGAYLHMAADALVSLGVVVAGLAILVTGLGWIDPLVSLVIVAVIAWGTWGLARDSLTMGLLAAPARIDLDAVRQHLAGFDGVTAVHDLHVWPMSTTEVALTAHLVMPGRPAPDRFLRDVAASLEHRFGVGHATLQVESGENPCGQGCH